MTSTSIEPIRASSLGSAPAIGAITHVALTVRDLSVSVPWYRQVIGVDPVLDEDTGPFRHVVFALGETLLGLHEFPEKVDETAAFDPRHPGLDHVAFSAQDRAELDRWHDRLQQLGVRCGGQGRPLRLGPVLQGSGRAAPRTVLRARHLIVGQPAAGASRTTAPEPGGGPAAGHTVLRVGIPLRRRPARMRRGSSTTGMPGSADSPRASPPTVPGDRAR